MRTAQGRRHQIRALLAHAHAPLAGDLRYGSGGVALSDASVALHAVQLQLPATLQLGRTNDLAGRVFTAPVPSAWQSWFGVLDKKG